jgi:hypothetical protein
MSRPGYFTVGHQTVAMKPRELTVPGLMVGSLL